MDFNRKPKRKARTVQDMVGLGVGVSKPKHRSNYQGPYKRTNEIDSLSGGRTSSASRTGSVSRASSAPRTRTAAVSRSSYVPPVRSGGFQDYAWIIFSGILAVCIIVTCVLYFTTNKKASYHYPLDVVTMTGVLNTIYEEQAGVSAPSADTSGTAAATGQTDPAATPDNTQTGTEAAGTDAAATGTTTMTGSTGAAMVLDSGTPTAGYTEAATYTELLSQLEGALASGDTVFVGSKLAYKDETTGALTGYPQSVVDHFTTYMAANGDKRTTFIQSIQEEATYSGQNGTAYVAVLPIIRYTLSTAYDNTSFLLTGFAEQTLNVNQSAVISPILPCMYTLTVSNAIWAEPLTQEVEAKFGENLKFDIGANQ